MRVAMFDQRPTDEEKPASALEKSRIRNALRNTWPVNLRELVNVRAVPLTSHLVAFHDYDLGLTAGHDLFGLGDSLEIIKTLKVLNINDGTILKIAVGKGEFPTIYPLTEDYFAVVESTNITIYDAKHCLIHKIIMQGMPNTKMGDRFLRSVFFREHMADPDFEPVHSFLKSEEFWSDHNKLFATDCHLIHDDKYLLYVNETLTLYDFPSLANEKKIIIPNADRIVILKSGYLAAHSKNENNLTIFKIENNLDLTKIKLITNVIEIAPMILADGNLVYRSDTKVEILNVTDFSTELVANINSEEPIFQLQVLFDGSISFMTRKDGLPEIIIYRFPKVYEDKHEMIYQAASKAQTNYVAAEEELIKILSGKYVSVDIFDNNEMSPAARLAQQGNRKAVQLLRKYGANINQIAKGAAMGSQPWVDELHEAGANINYIAFGAAWAGNINYAETLRLEHNANINYIAQGAVMNSTPECIEHAEFLRIHHNANVNFIAQAAARAGNRNYAENLRINHRANVDFIAKGAAGYVDNAYAEYLRTYHGANVSWMAEGAAQAKQYKYAMFLCRVHGAKYYKLACGAAYAGDQDYVNDLLLIYKDVSFACYVDVAIAGGGHQNLMQYFLARCQRGNSIACGGFGHKIEQTFLMGAGLGGHLHLPDLPELSNDSRKQTLLDYNFLRGGHGQYFDFTREFDEHQTSELATRIAEGGQFQYLQLLPNVDVKLLVRAIYDNGHWYYARNFEQRESVLKIFPINNVRTSLQTYQDPALDANVDNAENLDQDSYMIANITSKFDIKSSYALHTLSFVRSNVLFHRMQSIYDQSGSLRLFAQAKTIKSLKETFNYNQCRALGIPELIFLFLKFTDKDNIALLLVATFLAPITAVESKDLISKIRGAYYQKFHNAFFKPALNVAPGTAESLLEANSPTLCAAAPMI
jgi:hypothetical protein